MCHFDTYEDSFEFPKKSRPLIMFRQILRRFPSIKPNSVRFVSNKKGPPPSSSPFLKRLCTIKGLFGLMRVYAMEKREDKAEEDGAINFEEEIKRATLQGEKYLSQLMRVLRTLILQTSLEYQECLIKQIEMTIENTRIGPVGEHWDRLTHFRVQGNELKDELGKYQALANSIGDIVHSEVSASVPVGNEIVLKQLNAELEKLQRLCKEQLQEIHKYEKLLLDANRESILYNIP